MGAPASCAVGPASCYVLDAHASVEDQPVVLAADVAAPSADVVQAVFAPAVVAAVVGQSPVVVAPAVVEAGACLGLHSVEPCARRTQVHPVSAALSDALAPRAAAPDAFVLYAAAPPHPPKFATAVGAPAIGNAVEVRAPCSGVWEILATSVALVEVPATSLQVPFRLLEKGADVVCSCSGAHRAFCGCWPVHWTVVQTPAQKYHTRLHRDEVGSHTTASALAYGTRMVSDAVVSSSRRTLVALGNWFYKLRAQMRRLSPRGAAAAPTAPQARATALCCLCRAVQN